MSLDSLRRLTPLGLKVAVARAASGDTAGRLVRRMSGGTVSKSGLKFRSEPGSPPTIYAQIALGLYERAELHMITRFLDGSTDVVELGASIGITTCNIARQAKGRRVIAVEAASSLIGAAQANLTLNDLTNVTLVNKAIAYGCGPTVKFSESSVAGKLDAHGTIEVPAITLSELLSEHGIDEFVLVADVEGAELPIFLHDAPAIARCKRILIEMDGGDYDGRHWNPDAIEALIVGHGFERIYRHGPCATFDRIPSQSDIALKECR